MRPPFAEVRVPHDWFVGVVEKRTQPTPELGVDEMRSRRRFRRVFPDKEFVVEVIVVVQ